MIGTLFGLGVEFRPGSPEQYNEFLRKQAEYYQQAFSQRQQESMQREAMMNREIAKRLREEQYHPMQAMEMKQDADGVYRPAGNK